MARHVSTEPSVSAEQDAFASRRAWAGQWGQPGGWAEGQPAGWGCGTTGWVELWDNRLGGLRDNRLGGAVGQPAGWCCGTTGWVELRDNRLGAAVGEAMGQHGELGRQL